MKTIDSAISNLKTFALFLLIACIAPSYAQTPQQYLKSMSDSLAKITTFQYKALMRSKDMGSDQFEDRHFEVYAKQNLLYDGINYRFNWHIIERRKEMDLSFFFIGNDFFSVTLSKKFAFQDQQIHHLKQGDFFEYMRWLVFFDELTEPVDNLHWGKMIQSDHTYFDDQFLELHIQIVEHAKRILCLNKQSLFPERVVEIIREKALNMEQITEVHLSDIVVNTPLPDSVLSLQYYIEKGLDFQLRQKPLEKRAPITEPVRTQEFTTLLLQSPLVTGTGDTTTLEKMEGELFLIDFWYTSCPPCVKALPYLQSLSEKYGSKGLKVIGINSFDLKTKAFVEQKLRESGISYDNFFSERAFVNDLDIKGFPTMVLLSKDKKLITSGLGHIANLEALIEAELK